MVDEELNPYAEESQSSSEANHEIEVAKIRLFYLGGVLCLVVLALIIWEIISYLI